MVILKTIADIGLWINRLYYKQRLYQVYYNKDKSPSWFDHRIDLYYHWPDNMFWLERGILPRRYMFEGCNVLDLFCGDGYYSRYFHSTIAGHIDAIDKDPKAIEHARRWSSHPNIDYHVIDVLKEDFPQKSYDVILWFEAIEHLNNTEYAIAINKIKTAIGNNGILIGSTPIISKDAIGKGNWEHKNEFTSEEKLREFLGKDFKDIQIEITEYPKDNGEHRKTAYFYCRYPNEGR